MSDTFIPPVIGANGANGANGVHGSNINPLADPRAPVGTDFKAVAIGAGANLEALPTYFTDPLLQTGNLPGLAISSFNNRAIRQGTFVASSLCLWISGQINQYIPDDGNQINWQAEWQQALANFVLAMIPAGPDLGAYLPLAGGTMVGNIRFQSGISTILANNTWYYGLDTGGTARGLIIKNNNNDITINDGSAAHVVIAGQPVVNNNSSWSGRDTAGNIRAVIGLLSDNNIHIGDGTRDVYIDTVAHTLWVNSNLVIPNNGFVYGKDTGGTARAILGIATDNNVYIGSGGISATNIYAGGGQPIYLRSNTNALGVFQVNGYTYLQGGSRAYIPGGNDPLQIAADNGYYARNHYVVFGVRDWSQGCFPGGVWGLADESAGAVRFQIDTGGTATFFNACNINGGSTINNGCYIQSGTFTVAATANINGGMNVYNSLNVWSGGLYVAGGTLTVNGNVSVGGQVAAGYLYSSGNGNVAGQFNSNTCYTNYLRSYGNCDVGNFTCGSITSAGHTINGDCVVNGNGYVGGGQWTMQHANANNGLCVGGAAINFDYTLGFPIGNHSQWVSGLGLYAQFFSPYCDQRYKENISETDCDGLAAILPIRFYQYDLPARYTPRGEVSDNRSHVAIGILAQQVMESLPDAVVETDQPVKFNMDHPETGDPLCGWETRPALGVDLMTLIAYQMRAIQQLAERVVALESARA
jgi:hypothetical protein